MGWQSNSINPSTTTPAADISKIKNDLSVLRAVVGGGSDSDVPVGIVSSSVTPKLTAGMTAAQVTAAIQTAIDSLASGDVYIPEGTWLVQPQAHAGLAGTFGSSSVCIKPRSGLRLYGPGVLKLADGAGGPSGAVVGNWDGAAISDVHVEVRIDGNKSLAGGSMSGVVLVNAVNCSVSRSKIWDCSFNGIQFAVTSTACEASGNYITGSGYIGIQAQRASGAVIRGNRIYATTDNAIDCECDGYTQAQIIIAENVVSGCASGVFLESGGNAIVLGNDISHFNQAGVWMNRINTGSLNNIVASNKFIRGTGTAALAGVYCNNSVGDSQIGGNHFEGMDYSVWLAGTTSHVDVGRNYHKAIGKCLVYIPPDTNAAAKCRVSQQTLHGPLSGYLPFTTTPLGNAVNASARAYRVAFESSLWDLDAGGVRASSTDEEYKSGVSGALAANPAWSGAYSVYSGGETLIYNAGTALTPGRYVTINSVLYYVQALLSSGVWSIRSSSKVAGDYTSSTNGAHAFAEWYPEWQTT